MGAPAKEPVKVPEDEFKAAIRALLNTPPLPAAKVVTKRSKKKR